MLVHIILKVLNNEGMNYVFNKYRKKNKSKDYQDYVIIKSEINLNKGRNENTESPSELIKLMKYILITMKELGKECKISNITSIQHRRLGFYFIVPREVHEVFLNKLEKVNDCYINSVIGMEEIDCLFSIKNKLYTLEGKSASRWNIIDNMEFVSMLLHSLNEGEHVSTFYNYILPEDYYNDDSLLVQIIISTNTKRDVLTEFNNFNKYK